MEIVYLDFILWILLFLNRVCVGGEYPECGEGWRGVGDSCYWLERGGNVGWRGALEKCESVGAKLLSFNTIQEAEAVSYLLKTVDLTRSEWLTSGVLVGGRWEWEGDGTVVSFPFWHHTHFSSQPLHNILLSYHNSTYKWTAGYGNESHPYICERHKLDPSPPQSEEAAPEQFGLSPVESRQKEARPVLLKEPQDCTHYGNEGPKHFVLLECKAKGYPTPRITWHRGFSGQPLILNQDTSHILQVGGNLIFLSIREEDYGSYYCTASNTVGTVRSRKATLLFAYVNDFARRRLDIYSTAGLGKSISCLEPDHFPRSLVYGWMESSVKKFVKQSQRIMISGDGTLYFSYLKSEDQNSYSCNIVSSELQTGHYGPFFSLQVSHAQAGVPDVFPPKIGDEFLKIFPPEPQLGEPVTIECFAFGNPAPTYIWSRLEGKMPEKAVAKNFGRVLYIPIFSTDDQGTYRCIATNSHSATSKQILLHLNTVPKFLVPLQDKMVDQGSSVTFECKVFGDPKPDFEWFYNGSPISPLLLSANDIDRISVENNRLIIRGTKHRDTGVYQCIASNSLGQSNSATYLKVLNFTPSFSKFLPNQRIYAVKGGNAILSCTPEASPKPQISWLYDGHPIDFEGRFSLLKNGFLKIAGVRLTDAGPYVCSASSSYGASSAIVILAVSESLVAKISPGDEVDLAYQKNSSLHCGVEKNGCFGVHMDGCPEAAYSWTFNGQSVSRLPQFERLFVGRNGSTLFLTNASASHSGVYMCTIDTPAGQRSEASTVRVLEPPRTPLLLTVSSVESTSVLLSWTMPKNVHGVFEGELDAYRIELWTPQNLSWTIAQDSIPSVHPVVSDYVLEGLRAFQEYRFRVKAHNKEGWSEGSLPSLSTTTLPAAPSIPLTTLSVSSLSHGDILLSWKPLDILEWNSDHVGYVIQYALSSNASFFHEEEQALSSIAIDDSFASQHMIPFAESGYLECEKFQFFIIPFNDRGRGPTSDPVILTSSFSAPLRKVTNLQGEAVNSTQIDLHWEWTATPIQTPNASYNCDTKILGFQVSCDERGSKDEQVTRFQGYSGNMYNISLGGLKSGLWYDCQVSAIGFGGKPGPHSDSVSIRTFLSAPKGPLEFYIVQEEKENAELEVRWSEVQTSGLQEPIEGYRLLFFQGPTSTRGMEIEIPVSLLDNPAHPSVKIQGLHSMTVYRSQLAAYSKGGLGPFTKTVQFRYGANVLVAGSSSHFSSYLITRLLLCASLFCLSLSRFLLIR